MKRLEEWIEFMEGEGDLKDMEQLSFLLKHSIADQVVLDNLRRLRKLVKLADPTEDIEDMLSNAEFLNKMHNSIMGKINGSNDSKTISNSLSGETTWDGE